MVVDEQVKHVPIKQVAAAADNIRDSVGDVVELSTSIAESGLVQPLIVRQLENGNFEVVAGARRLAAAEIAGLESVPVIVRAYTDEQRLLAMAIENLQREDLSPLEEARAYQRLLEITGASQRELAPRVGKTQPHISKRLALLQLPKDIQKQVDAGGITIPDALELAKLADDPPRLKKALAGSPWQDVATRVRVQLEDISREKKCAKLAEDFESKGYATVVVTSHWQLPKGVHRLKGGNHYDPQALDITPKKHETEPCHAIAIPKDGQGAFPVCTNRSNHPKVRTKQEADRGSGTRRATAPLDKTTKQLQEARAARMTFIAELIAKKPTKDALQLIMLRDVEREVDYFDGDPDLDRVAILLGVVDAPEDRSTILPDDVDPGARILEFAYRGEAEAQRAALALALLDLDGHELESVLRGHQPRQMRMGADTRPPARAGRAYLEFLRARGHSLHELEQKVLDNAETIADAA